MTTFTTEDRQSAQADQKEPIPFAGIADLTKLDHEVWHFEVNAERGETSVTAKVEFRF